MDYVIQVTDLVKSFGKETVLHHIKETLNKSTVEKANR